MHELFLISLYLYEIFKLSFIVDIKQVKGRCLWIHISYKRIICARILKSSTPSTISLFPLREIASVKQLKTEFDEKDLPDTISIDASFMQRAIINVVSNAVDYSPEHGTIWFSVSAKDNKIRFTVTDSGKGFSPEDLRNATNQFYQGDFSRSSKLHYGMGLFIADSIVKQHGGTLVIANSSTTGGGMVSIEI